MSLHSSNDQAQINKLLAHAWDNMDDINHSLKQLQNEVHSDELGMTIDLIEEKLPLTTSKNSLLLQYLSVILIEVTYFLSTIDEEHNDSLSHEGIKTLEEIISTLTHFQKIAKMLQNQLRFS